MYDIGSPFVRIGTRTRARSLYVMGTLAIAGEYPLPKGP